MDGPDRLRNVDSMTTNQCVSLQFRKVSGSRCSREFAETNRGSVFPNDLQKLGDVLSEDVAVLANGFPVVFLPLAHLGTGSLHEHGIGEIALDGRELLLTHRELLLESTHVILDVFHDTSLSPLGDGEHDRNARHVRRHVNLRRFIDRFAGGDAESCESLDEFEHGSGGRFIGGGNEDAVVERCAIADCATELAQRTHVADKCAMQLHLVDERFVDGGLAEGSRGEVAGVEETGGIVREGVSCIIIWYRSLPVTV